MYRAETLEQDLLCVKLVEYREGRCYQKCIYQITSVHKLGNKFIDQIHLYFFLKGQTYSINSERFDEETKSWVYMIECSCDSGD